MVILLTAVHNAYTYISPFPNVTGDSQLPYPWGWKLEGGGVGDGNWREGGGGELDAEDQGRFQWRNA